MRYATFSLLIYLVLLAPSVMAVDEVWSLDTDWMSVPGGGRTLVSHRYPEGTPVRELSRMKLVKGTIFNEDGHDRTVVIFATEEQHRQMVEFLVKSGYESPLKPKLYGE